ncbi:MAG: hypothetical protein HY898_04130 [Deltaproteobacteria bacterium]|nr:hypothetical protein [Deltaproteobacteria bacterium]
MKSTKRIANFVRKLRPGMLLWLFAVIVGLGFLIIKGARAQAPDEQPRSGHGAGAGRKLVVRASASAEPAPSAPAASASAPQGPSYEEPVDYATLGPNGGVPTHEGRFKSPFSHPRFGGPATVQVGLLLANVRDYDIQKGAFEADFFLSLTSDKPMPPMDLVFPNGKVDLAEKVADKPTFKLYRFIGSFSSPPDLHAYPFDTQELRIEIEDDDNGIDQIRLVPDEEHTNLDVGFHVPGWETAFIRARVLSHYFPDRFKHDDLYYGRYVFGLGLRRFGTSAVFTVYVPAAVIVLISLMGLWLPRHELEVRANSTTPMLAAAVLFHFALMQALPATAYLTRADKLMIAVYGILLLHMGITWLWFVFDESRTEAVLKWGKWVGAPLTILGLLGGILL